MTILNQPVTPVMSNSSDSNSSIIRSYLQAKQKIMQRDATPADVEKLMGFYSDSLYYEHVLSPEKKFIFKGKTDLQGGYSSHLGETRNVKITLLNLIEKQNILVAEYAVKREIISTGKTEDSKIVSLYEIDSNGKIKRMIDYL